MKFAAVVALLCVLVAVVAAADQVCVCVWGKGIEARNRENMNSTGRS